MEKKALIFTAFLALVLLQGFSHAAQVCDFASGLPAEIYITPPRFNQTPTTIDASVTVDNIGAHDLVIRLVRLEGGNCQEIKVLGVAQNGGSETFQMQFESRYPGQAKKTTKYAIVATGGDVPIGKYFQIDEDWMEYEAGIQKQVNEITVFAVPAIAIALVIIIIVLAEWAYLAPSEPEGEQEYTMKTLFFPALRGRPFSQIVAGFLTSPFFWMIEALAIAAMGMIIWSGAEGRLGAVGLQVVAISFAGALFVPVIYFAIIWYFNEMMGKKPMRFFAGAFFWGMLSALISLVLNSLLMAYLHESLSLDSALVVFIATAAVAPFVEEAVKGIGILGLFGNKDIDDAMNGLLLGFSVGLGFAFIENWFYFSSKVNPLEMGIVPWGFLAIYRMFFNSMAHGCFTAAIGAALGWARWQRLGKFTSLAFIPGLQLAVALHVIFNITAIMDSFAADGREVAVYIFNPTLVLTLLGLMFIVFAITSLRFRARITRGRAYELMLKGLEGK